jgi:acyl carrier protein
LLFKSAAITDWRRPYHHRQLAARAEMMSRVIDTRIRVVVASALDVPIERVTDHASLINDLGAESIDFIDIVFRLETDFGIEIPQEEIWKGSIDPSDEASIAAGIARLKAAMPEFRWDALPARLTKNDLPALITVSTITHYMRKRLNEQAPA